MPKAFPPWQLLFKKKKKKNSHCNRHNQWSQLLAVCFGLIHRPTPAFLSPFFILFVSINGG